MIDNGETDTVSPPGGDEIKAITRNGKPIPVTSRLFALVISIAWFRDEGLPRLHVHR